MPEVSHHSAGKSHRRNRRIRRFVAAAVLVSLTVGIYLGFWRLHTKRYQVVREGVLYRSAQPTELGFWYFIKRKGVKSVINTRRANDHLRSGIYDPGEPSGRLETDYVASLGARNYHWVVDKQSGWPWPDPWMLEQYFKLIDEPKNHPVLIHCMGGRHRTGTLAALYRLEYDRWPVERTLEEMFSFNFGPAINIQEHNLRTYLPRPHPDSAAWKEIVETFQPVLSGPAPKTYEQLVRKLRIGDRSSKVDDVLSEYVRSGRPFALCIVERLIDSPQDKLVDVAIEAAVIQLNAKTFDPAELSSAAALIADFGDPSIQHRLQEELAAGTQTPEPTRRYESLVAGVTNRYTANRIAFLRPLLSDRRSRMTAPAKKYRYCDTAVARLSVIIDENLIDRATPAGISLWENGRRLALQWFEDHENRTRLSVLQPATKRRIEQANARDADQKNSPLRR